MKCKYGCAFKDKRVIRVDDNNNRHILESAEGVVKKKLKFQTPQEKT